MKEAEGGRKENKAQEQEIYKFDLPAAPTCAVGLRYCWPKSVTRK